jgi:hypothetical protein
VLLQSEQIRLEIATKLGEESTFVNVIQVGLDSVKKLDDLSDDLKRHLIVDFFPGLLLLVLWRRLPKKVN